MDLLQISTNGENAVPTPHFHPTPTPSLNQMHGLVRRLNMIKLLRVDKLNLGRFTMLNLNVDVDGVAVALEENLTVKRFL